GTSLPISAGRTESRSKASTESAGKDADRLKTSAELLRPNGFRKKPLLRPRCRKTSVRRLRERSRLREEGSGAPSYLPVQLARSWCQALQALALSSSGDGRRAKSRGRL